MITDDMPLPKLPPLGDVTTEVGLFRLATSRMIHVLDNHLRYEYPLAVETVEIYMDALQMILDHDTEHIQRQLTYLAKSTINGASACTDPACPEEGRHELMAKIVGLIADTPSEIFEEKTSKGFIVGQSMN